MITGVQRQLFYLMSFIWWAGAPCVFAIGLFFLAYGGETAPQHITVSSSATTTIAIAARHGFAGSSTIIYGHLSDSIGSVPRERELGCHLVGNTAPEGRYFPDSTDTTFTATFGGHPVTALMMVLSDDQAMLLSCDSAALRQVEPLYAVVTTRPEPVNRFLIAGVFFASAIGALIFGTASFYIFRPSKSRARPATPLQR
jgi:hypothetical protein